MLLRNILLLSTIGIGSSLPPGPIRSTETPPRVVANDNRHPAGVLENGVLKIRLVVQMARWYPEADDGPFVDVPVLAEEGKPPQIPAPLIRVPAGTTIDATIHNDLDSTIYMWGLRTKPAIAFDSIPVLPGETRAIRFDAGAAGTYHYAASTMSRIQFGAPVAQRKVESQQLAGGFVIDPANARMDDRIFILNIWAKRNDSTPTRNAIAINGKSWPYTERISATVGDTLRWRVINPTIRAHPLHLHGSYFRVDAHGTLLDDSVYTPEQRRLAVTEDLSAGHSMAMTIVPITAGNWLFHCHLTFHVTGGARLKSTPEPDHDRHSDDPGKHMAGLVLGINVKPRTASAPLRRTNPRVMRLFVDEGRRRYSAPRSLGFVLQRGRRAPAPDSIEMPGTTLVMTRDQPTDVIVTNRLKEATAIHWHGLELESYSDGVPGWSGMGDHLAPVIAPGKSFVAHLTLRRAGTFIYHTHLNDVEQITSGLYGAIVVLEPGQRFNPRTDHVIVAAWDGPTTDPIVPLIDGDTSHPLELAFGVAHRLRFINIGAAGRQTFTLRQDTTVMKWRRLAKDGADLPAAAAIVSRASQRLNVGETFDAEFTPPAKGEYTLAIVSQGASKLYTRRVVVR